MSQLHGISDHELVLTIENLLARTGGVNYDAEIGARQSTALLRFIKSHYVSINTAAFLISRAREHELIAIVDLIANMPGSTTNLEVGSIATFAGGRAAIIRNDRDTLLAEALRDSETD